MTTWKNLFEDACKRGEESAKKWRECERSGGHYQDKLITMNGNIPAWKCRCGFYAPKTAKIWSKK